MNISLTNGGESFEEGLRRMKLAAVKKDWEDFMEGLRRDLAEDPEVMYEPF